MDGRRHEFEVLLDRISDQHYKIIEKYLRWWANGHQHWPDPIIITITLMQNGELVSGMGLVLALLIASYATLGLTHWSLPVNASLFISSCWLGVVAWLRWRAIKS